MKRIKKAKNRVKSVLEVPIKAIYSKYIKIVFAIETADCKRKKIESVVQYIGFKHREFQQIFAKQKRLRNIWCFFDRRKNDLLNQRSVFFVFWIILFIYR